MIYICFHDEKSLSKFKKFLKENILSCNNNLKNMCKEACEEEESIYKIDDFTMILKEWNNYCISLIPCNAYKGLGAFEITILEEIVEKLNHKDLVELIRDIVNKYDVEFLAIGSEVLEPIEDIIPRPVIRLGVNIHAIYFKDTNRVYELCKKSLYVNGLLGNLDFDKIYHNLPIPASIDLILNEILGKLCKVFKRKIFNENDLLCIV